MKVLLTGANGFVGSHVLDSLCARGIAAAVLLRPAGNRRFLEAHLPRLEVRTGSIGDPPSLAAAMRDITHVVHCAGCVRALGASEFYQVNQAGTRHVVQAVNEQQGRIQRLVHISSLAAGGPATPDKPARENDPPNPVSEYGKSKLAGEQEVRGACGAEFVILRPPAVYGPRDTAFLPLFKAVQAHVLPRFGDGRLALSLVFVKDLAEAVVTCLAHPAAAGKTFYVASPEVTSAPELAGEIAAQMKVWTLPLPVPGAGLWLLCGLREAVSRLTRKPGMLGWQKYAELRAPGWVCDPGRLRQELGFACANTLEKGISTTLAWYRQQGWL
ncbi:MAG: NAD-dependent epimerase/dehydratase family protein [Verrucomicrobiota bacterium]|jgi:nucleoside-diphosphate-sugar epimerase